MSFLTGTQCELLYAMPANGPAVTAASITRLSAGSSATNPPYFLPAYFFPDTYGVGKSLMIRGAGFFTIGTTAVTDIITVALDTTAGTAGTTIAATGAFTTTASVTNGAFKFDIDITCTDVGTSAVLNATGLLHWGTSNNAATTANTGYMIGAPNAGVAFSNATGYFIEVFNTWSATTGAPTITMTNFTIWGLN